MPSFEVLANAIPQVVWIASDRGEIEYFNQKWYELTGEEPGERAMREWKTRMHPDDVAKVEQAVRHSVTTNDVFYAEVRFRDRNGAFRWHLARALPFWGQGGSLKWLGTATDIEEQKRTESALREEQQRKNEFLATLGHELRNPLTPLRNAIVLLGKPELTLQEQDRLRGIADRQVGQMARLIGDLLDVVRITTGRISLRRRRLDLVALLRDVVDAHMDEFRRRGVVLEGVLPSAPHFVDGDPERLVQVVGNLLDNAAKFTSAGGSTTVELLADARRGRAQIRVSDTGAGMSRETLARVFRPFSQPEEGRSLGSSGLGLGLSIVKGLIELHGGEVKATSDGPGLGSEFTLDLPLLRDEGALDVPDRNRRAQSEEGKRILLVEDNADAGETLSTLLALNGHSVTLAATAEEGISEARRLHPDVVLSDIGLPGQLSGYDVARTVHRESEDTVLIALTGYGQREDRERALAAGFSEWLVKPFDQEQLETLIRTAQPRPSPGRTRKGARAFRAQQHWHRHRAVGFGRTSPRR